MRIDAYRVQQPKIFWRSWARTTKWANRTSRQRAAWRVFRGLRVLAYLTWRRTWQAEWDGCERAVRAYTRRGLYRRLTAQGIKG